jgi:hypothetical protein
LLIWLSSRKFVQFLFRRSVATSMADQEFCLINALRARVKDFAMRKTLMLAMGVAALLGGASVSAQAMPIDQNSNLATLVEHAAWGCPPGYHPNDWGRCVPFRRWAPPVYRPRWGGYETYPSPPRFYGRGYGGGYGYRGGYERRGFYGDF